MEKHWLTKAIFDSYTRPEPCTQVARAALQTALAALAAVSDGAVVPETHLSALADAYNHMADVERALPKVECWCVVKHYSNESEGVWKPAVWLGCTTKEQAEAFAPAIAKHYDRKYRETSRDRFVVERAACGIRQVVHPELTAEAYVAGLGS